MDQKERMQNYYQNNKEMIRKKSKIYREKNKESINERKKLYYKKNRVTILKKQKLYCQENFEALKEQRRLHYQKNKEEILQKHKLYNEKNRVAISECGKLYRKKNWKIIVEKKCKAKKQRMATDEEFRRKEIIRAQSRFLGKVPPGYERHHFEPYTVDDFVVIPKWVHKIEHAEGWKEHFDKQEENYGK